MALCYNEPMGEAKPYRQRGYGQVDVTPYVEGMRQRARSWAKQCETARLAAREDIKSIASYLVQAGASRVVLFGSLLRPHEFTPLSDIDLAVEGLTWPAYWKVLSAVHKMTSFHVDLVMLEDASAEFCQRILLEGEVVANDR